MGASVANLYKMFVEKLFEETLVLNGPSSAAE